MKPSDPGILAQEEEGRASARRLRLLYFLFAAAFCLLFFRFFDLQIRKYTHLDTLAKKNRVSVLPLAPARGIILAADGTILAENRSFYALAAVSALVPDAVGMLDALSQVIPLSETEKELFLKNFRQSPRWVEIPLKDELSMKEAARFSAFRHRFPAVFLRATSKRYYPLGPLFAHVVGYVGAVSKKDLETLEEEGRLGNYRGTSTIGKEGVERVFEEELHGQGGYEIVETDALGNPVRVLETRMPQAGKHLTLALDPRLQESAISALGLRTGALVALDVKSGKVLALASTPLYDPNWFSQGLDPKLWPILFSQSNAFNNRAISGLYPPGSTIKPFVAVTGVQEGVVNEHSRIWDPGYYTLPGDDFAFRDWKRGGHGWVDLPHAIAWSCDTFFYSLATSLGIDRLAAGLAQFGFGKPTGIDLNGESGGVLPSRAWKRKRFNKPWYPGETVIAGIGQGYFLATPLQLAWATARLAANGRMPMPSVVQGDGYEKKEANGLAAPLAPSLGEEPFAAVRKAMEMVTSPGGTAFRAFADAPYRAGGKTGTAQVYGFSRKSPERPKPESAMLRDHALFIAYAPAEDPRIAVAVVLEHGGSGSADAAPIARRFLDEVLGVPDVPGPEKP